MMPTASAVVADIIEVAMGNSGRLFKHLKLEPRKKIAKYIGKIDELTSRFYIKLKVLDEPGVFAKICAILAKNQISLSGVLQHEEHNAKGLVPAIVITHQTGQKKISKAMTDMSKLAIVKEKPVCIRIVDIPEDKD
jgi:homoserine dehydrogenase